MGGNTDTCNVDNYFLKGNDRENESLQALCDLGIVKSRMSDKDPLCVILLVGSESVLDILLKATFKLAAVLLSYYQLAVRHYDRGLDLKYVCTESRKSGASAALGEIIESINNKACVDVFLEFVCKSLYLGSGQSFSRLFGALDGKYTLTGGEQTGVNGADIFKLSRRKGSVLIRSGKLTADIDVNYLISLVGKGFKKVNVIGNGTGGRLGKLACLLRVLVYIPIIDSSVIGNYLIVIIDPKTELNNAVLLAKINGQVTGAVRSNDSFYFQQ